MRYLFITGVFGMLILGSSSAATQVVARSEAEVHSSASSTGSTSKGSLQIEIQSAERAIAERERRIQALDKEMAQEQQSAASLLQDYARRSSAARDTAKQALARAESVFDQLGAERKALLQNQDELKVLEASARETEQKAAAVATVVSALGKALEAQSAAFASDQAKARALAARKETLISRSGARGEEIEDLKREIEDLKKRRKDLQRKIAEKKASEKDEEREPREGGGRAGR